MKATKNGYTFLEFAITLPLTMLVLFGITDIMRVLSAQTAVDSATEAALRCLSPINGECSNNKKDSYVKKFDVYELEQINQYIADGYTFNATANTISTKVHESVATAQVLDKGYVQVKPFSTTFKELSYPADFNINYYLMTKSLPKILLKEGQSLDSQEFVLKRETGTEYEPTITRDKSFTLSLNSNDTESSEEFVQFKIERPFDCNENIPCYVSENIDKSNAGNNKKYNKTCNLAFKWKANDKYGPDGNSNKVTYKDRSMTCETTPIVLFIKGTADIQGRDNAKVEIDLCDENGALIRKLGGRAFDANSNASFVARGAEYENYSKTLQEIYGNAEITYHQAIQIDYNKKYKIKFKLFRTNKHNQQDSVKWKFIKLYIFTPEYKLKNLNIECKNPIFLSESKKKKLDRCEPKDVSKASILPEMNYDFKVTDEDGVKSSEGKELKSECSTTSNQNDIEGLLVANNLSQNLSGSFYVEKVEACDGTKEIAVDCPKNYGSKNRGDYAKKCPIDVTRINYDFKDSYTPKVLDKYDTKNINLGVQKWQKNNCNDNKDYLPDEWKKYEVLNIKDKDVTLKTINFNSNECDKDVLTKYACDDFIIKANNIVPDQSNHNQRKTLLYGKHAGIRCEWENDGWKDILRNEITSNWNGYNKSCFDLSREKSGKIVLNNLSQLDECTTYQLSSLHSSEARGDEPLASNVTEDEIPNSCKTSGNICEIVFRGYEKVDNNGMLDRDLDTAKNLAFNKINLLFPKSNKDCEGNYCVTLQSHETQDDVTFEANMKVPMYVLLGKRIDITSSSMRKKEKF